MKLIDKDALVAEIDRQKIGYNTDGKHSVEYNTTRKILNIINTLEVKEVDLDNAVEHFIEQHKSELRGGYFDIRRIARHFFELGLKKGE